MVSETINSVCVKRKGCSSSQRTRGLPRPLGIPLPIYFDHYKFVTDSSRLFKNQCDTISEIFPGGGHGACYKKLLVGV